MGAWGTGILQDDAALDIYQDYLRRWDDGEESAVSIRAGIAEDFADAFEDGEDGPVSWLALAQAQWECGVLQADILAKAEEIVVDGSDLKQWEVAIHPESYGRRRGVLKRFLVKIRTPRAHPRPQGPRRRRSPYARALYPAGACLAIQLSDGDWVPCWCW